MDIDVIDDRISLADFLGEAPTEVEKDAFKVDTIEKAEWCMKQAGDSEYLIQRYEGERDRLIARLNEVCIEKTKEAFETVERMGYYLDSWSREEAKKIKKKTIPMVNGEIKITTGRESLIVDDEPALMKWLNTDHQELLKVVETISADKNGIKKLLTGDVKVPGCRLERGPDKLILKPKLAEIE